MFSFHSIQIGGTGIFIISESSITTLIFSGFGGTLPCTRVTDDLEVAGAASNESKIDNVIAPDDTGSDADTVLGFGGGTASNESNIDEAIAPDAADSGADTVLGFGGGTASNESNIDEVIAPDDADFGADTVLGFGGDTALNESKMDEAV
jgi:hypothetical protein